MFDCFKKGKDRFLFLRLFLRVCQQPLSYFYTFDGSALPMFAHDQTHLILFIIYNNSSIIIRMLRFAQSKTLTWCLNQSKFFSTRTVNNIDFVENDSFLKVVLNRPKALNSLNLQMIRDLNANLGAIGNNKAFWMQGTGGKAFCAGGDVKALFDKESKPEDRLAFFREEFKLDYKISQLPALQIANWDGIVMGGGFGVSAFSPFIIATENSMFAMPEAKLGFFTDVGSSYLLSRLRNNIGFYLGLSGSRLKGEDVYLSGLANYYFHRDSIQPAYEEIKQTLPKSTNPRETIHSILSKYHRQPKATKIGHEDQIKEIFSAPTVQDLYKRVSSDSEKFCVAMTKAINEQCPLSLGVIHRLIHLAKNKTLKECFIQDFNLAQKYAVDPNFAEGVRTVLVDRGSEPNWSHKHVLQVTQQDVDKYFNWPSSFETLNI